MESNCNFKNKFICINLVNHEDRRRLADMSLEERDAWTLEQQKKLIEEDSKRDKKWKLGLIEESGYLCLGDTYQEPGKPLMIARGQKV